MRRVKYFLGHLLKKFQHPTFVLRVVMELACRPRLPGPLFLLLGSGNWRSA
jgi:hypothetical protein